MTRSPYTPPRAPVSERLPDVVSEALPRPWPVTVAVGLIWIFLAIRLVNAAIDTSSLALGGAGLMTYSLHAAGRLLQLLLVLFASICVSDGQRWARILCSVIAAYEIFEGIKGTAKSFENSWMTGVFEIAVIAVLVASVILMFVPSANDWFRRRYSRAKA